MEMDQPFLNVSFMFASILSLVLLSRKRSDDCELFDLESDCSDNESEIDVDSLSTQAPMKHSFIYTTLLQNMDKEEKMDFDRMPTFEEMMNTGKRRCYSADDIDALDLMPDSRIKGIFDEALDELRRLNSESEEETICDGRTTPSIKSVCSWDHLN